MSKAQPMRKTPWLTYSPSEHWFVPPPYGVFRVCAEFTLEVMRAIGYKDDPPVKRLQIRIWVQESPKGEWYSAAASEYVHSPFEEDVIPLPPLLRCLLAGSWSFWRGHVWIEWRER